MLMTQVVGVTALFFWPAPLALKHGYLVVVGTVTAYIFTFVPEWTTWALLVAMALYDLWGRALPGRAAQGAPLVPNLRLSQLAAKAANDLWAVALSATPSRPARDPSVKASASWWPWRCTPCEPRSPRAAHTRRAPDPHVEGAFPGW